VSHSETIDAFIAAWGRMDIDAVMDFFTDDAIYENVPIDPPNEGKEAIRKTIDGLTGMATGVEWIVHHQVASGNVVMNERTDRFKIGDRWVGARVMGVFELEGDKIAKWRDYFDLQQFQSELAG